MTNKRRIFLLVLVVSFLHASLALAETTKTVPMFDFSKESFEKSIAEKAMSLNSPPWREVSTAKYQIDFEVAYQMSERVTGNVLYPNSENGIKDILLVLHQTSHATNKDISAFFLSFASALATVAPDMTPAERGILLNDLKIGSPNPPADKMVVVRHGLKVSSMPIAKDSSFVILIEPEK